MPDDALSAALEEDREALAALRPAFELPLDETRASAAAGMLLARAELAMDAVLAALKHHRPSQLYSTVENYKGEVVCGHGEDYDGDLHFEGDDGLWYCKDHPTVTVCKTCCDGPSGDLMAEWPCPTYAAILAALTGEGDGGG